MTSSYNKPVFAVERRRSFGKIQITIAKNHRLNDADSDEDNLAELECSP